MTHEIIDPAGQGIQLNFCSQISISGLKNKESIKHSISVTLQSIFFNMVAKKRKSKRQTLQQKFKIIKRTQEHHRKLKKGVTVGHNAKKAPKDHIPNAWPYKEELLKEIQSAKERMEENKLRQKEKRREEVVRNLFTYVTLQL